MSSPRQPRLGRARMLLVAAYALCACGVAAAGVVATASWIGQTFPGFFVMPNRVVPSVALEGWTGTRAARIFQTQVEAVDGTPVASADAVYRHVAGAEPGRTFRYTLRRDTGREQQIVPSMRFTSRDYLWFFAPLLLNGVVFTVVGLFVWTLGRPSPPTTGVTILTLNLGLFCLTALDLYRPGALFRVHILTEAMVPATLVYLALVFPVARLERYRRRLMMGVVVANLAAALAYLAAADDPPRYSQLHNVSMVLWGVGGLAFICSSLHAYLTSTSVLVRKRLGVIALGLMVGFGLPAWVLTWSGLFGGEAPINLALFTAFVFPLSLAYAVVKHDLFEIDALLRRGLSYLVLTGVVVSAYALLVLGSGFMMQSARLAQSPFFPIIFSVLMIIFFNPIRDRTQRTVDRIFHRSRYNPQHTLEGASAALAATLDVDAIHRLTIDTPHEALLLEHASLWMSAADGSLDLVLTRGEPPALPARLGADDALAARLRETGRPATIYDDVGLGETEADPVVEALGALGADVAVPIGQGELTGFLALGRKKSQTIYTRDDLEFLRTFANQVVVAVDNARSYREIEELNVGLEEKVTERTQELAVANGELATSLRELESAYAELQRSQEKLFTAEKMAALGRLTAGIAHEINTPLGATMNSLTVLGDLVDEYTRSIGDPEVDEADHREIAAELGTLVKNLKQWTDKAAGYIRGMKAHTHQVAGGDESLFDLTNVLDDIRSLLSHRLRLSSCTMTIESPPGLLLYGDSTRLSQVVTNLVTNAIDAYDDQGTADGPIRVLARSTGEQVEISVEDEGCGIPAEHLARIFDELFTTKAQGKGTGLGLSISNDIVRNGFGGHIDVTSTPGRGTRFTLVLPVRTRGGSVAAAAASC